MTAKYLIGYLHPDTCKSEEMYIQTDYIDFSVYNPENIYYISKYISKFDGQEERNAQHTGNISLYVDLDLCGLRSAQSLIRNYECCPEMYKPLSLYDKMLIWMFNNPDRAKYEISKLKPEAQERLKNEQYLAKVKYWDFDYDKDICGPEYLSSKQIQIHKNTIV